MRLATLRTTVMLLCLAVDAQLEAPSARAPQPRQRASATPQMHTAQRPRHATERPPPEARRPQEGPAGASRPRARSSPPAGRTARSGRRRRRRHRRRSPVGRVISALPSAAAAVARLTGNASVAAGRLAARLATPAPWEALAARVSRAALRSRRWAGARARALQASP